jgi:hypothetical protein
VAASIAEAERVRDAQVGKHDQAIYSLGWVVFLTATKDLSPTSTRTPPRAPPRAPLPSLNRR